MNILIFGATGGTGTHLVEQALQRGHSATAFVRDPARLTRTHPSLRCIAGDVMDAATVPAAVAGQDAIVCALGTMPESKPDLVRRQPDVPVCSVGTRNILQAMANHGVRRIVVETSSSIGESRRTGKFGAATIIRLLLRAVMADKERQEAIVRGSGLDWTIIRPVRLTDGARSGRVRCGDGIAWSLMSKVSRADVAAVMLDAVDDSGTLRRAISVLT
jgi:uncharacterized protein YbjT (DUF2867 family)